MALIGGIAGSALALLCMEPIINALQGAFLLSHSIWTWKLAALCAIAGTGLACLLGFAAALAPAVHSSGMDPQSAITQGELS